jgi:hypothetical protein
MEQQSLLPWTTSIFAESTIQSLCIIKIVSDTSRVDEEPGSFDYVAASEQEKLMSTISSSSLFGFTIGASGMLIKCIADIRRLVYEFKTGISIQYIDDAAHELLLRLDRCREISAKRPLSESDSNNFKNSKMALYHLNAFIAATYIYLYQALFDVPPSHVRRYVEEVFHNIQAFFALGNGNFSLWPAFIAAAASCEPDDVAAAKEWLRSASNFGIGNRVKVQAAIEEIWRLREVISGQTNQDLGSIIVDWRDVMQKLGLDIPLV